MKFSSFNGLAAFLVGFAIATGFISAEILPDLQKAGTPDPAPVAPNGWDIFSPPVSASIVPSVDTPTIAEWTHIGGPDDTVILTGDKLSSFAAADEGRDTEFLFYGQTTLSNGTAVAGSIQRLDGMKAAVTLPLSLPPWSTYLLWPKNSAGTGNPVVINRTEAWWLTPNDKVTRGDTVSIFGRNLAHSGGTTTSWVYLKPAGAAATGEWTNVTSVNPYRVQFTVPDHLANGDYEVWIHNGHGANYGWSGPLSLTVTDPYQWNGASFNVKDYGATGDGITDDTEAIMNAHSAALTFRDHGGSPPTLHPTLYFPAGIYLMNRGISLKHDVRYLGEGKALTILRCNAQFQDTADQGLIYGERDPEHDIEVSNFTLDANGHFAETSFPYDYLLCFTFVSQWKDIRLSNLGIEVPNPGNRVNAVSFGDVSRLTIADCDLTGGNINLMNSNHVVIHQCSFSLVNDGFTAINAQAVNAISVTQCECADHDPNSDTGQGLGRFVVLGGYLGSQRNIYIGDNRTANYAPRPGAADFNSGEQILSEGNDVRYEGAPAAATPTTVAFTDLAVDPMLRSVQTAVIVKGKGMGQSRTITAINYPSRTITVSPAWNVVPDSTSMVQIAWTTDRCVIYHNTLDGKSDYATRFNNSNSCAMLAYGGCNEWIGDSNTITHMRYAIGVMGLAKHYPDTVATSEPCFFHYYANNSIRECYRGCFCYADTAVDSTNAAVPRLGFFGNVFRKNLWSDLVSTGICFDGATSGVPVDMSLFEHNTFTNLPQGIDFYSHAHDSETANTVLYKNTFDRGIAPSDGSFGANFIASTFSPVLRENTWSNFSKTYTGVEIEDSPGVPGRTVDFQAIAGNTTASAAIVIYNSGTKPLLWTASTDSSWLTLTPSSGTVLDQSSASSLAVTCHISGLPSGTHEAIVSIAGGGLIQKISVTLTVGSIAISPQQVKVTMTVIPPESGSLVTP